MSEKTLANWRSAGRGPAWSRLAGIHYTVDDVVAFERTTRIKPRPHRQKRRR